MLTHTGVVSGSLKPQGEPLAGAARVSSLQAEGCSAPQCRRSHQAAQRAPYEDKQTTSHDSVACQLDAPCLTTPVWTTAPSVQASRPRGAAPW